MIDQAHSRKELISKSYVTSIVLPCFPRWFELELSFLWYTISKNCILWFCDLLCWDALIIFSDFIPNSSICAKEWLTENSTLTSKQWALPTKFRFWLLPAFSPLMDQWLCNNHVSNYSSKWLLPLCHLAIWGYPLHKHCRIRQFHRNTGIRFPLSALCFCHLSVSNFWLHKDTQKSVVNRQTIHLLSSNQES